MRFEQCYLEHYTGPSNETVMILKSKMVEKLMVTEHYTTFTDLCVTVISLNACSVVQNVNTNAFYLHYINCTHLVPLLKTINPCHL